MIGGFSLALIYTSLKRFIIKFSCIILLANYLGGPTELVIQNRFESKKTTFSFNFMTYL